jgi:hypothetical protein
MVKVGTALSDGPRTDPVADPEARTIQAPFRINPNFPTQDCFSHSSGSVQANALYIMLFLREYSHVWQFATLALKKKSFHPYLNIFISHKAMVKLNKAVADLAAERYFLTVAIFQGEKI